LCRPTNKPNYPGKKGGNKKRHGGSCDLRKKKDATFSETGVDTTEPSGL